MQRVHVQKRSYTNTWIFDIPELLEYYREYRNEGVKLFKIQFYACTLATDPAVFADDFCRFGDGTPIISSNSEESTSTTATYSPSSVLASNVVAAPEFPSPLIPASMIIVFLEVVLLIQRTKEH